MVTQIIRLGWLHSRDAGWWACNPATPESEIHSCSFARRVNVPDGVIGGQMGSIRCPKGRSWGWAPSEGAIQGCSIPGPV